MKTAQEITEVINALRGLCGVGICYYDLENFFDYNRLGIKNNRGHYCGFCVRAHELPDGRYRCDRSDRRDAVLLAREHREPFFYVCHMGLTEYILPLWHLDALIGILFVGQCRIAGENDLPAVLRNAERFGGDPDCFRRLYEALPELERENLLQVGQILAPYLGTKIRYGGLSGTSDGDEHGGLAAGVAAYIDRHFAEVLSTRSLAEKFFVSEEHLSRRFRRAYGVTLTAYLRNARLCRAEKLLRETAIPVLNVAMNVGFSDADYFARVFRRCYGTSPTQWRNGARENAADLTASPPAFAGTVSD